jgi:hypothetical protein
MTTPSLTYDEQVVHQVKVSPNKRVVAMIVTPITVDGTDLQQYIELRDSVRQGQTGGKWTWGKGVEMPVWHIPELTQSMIDAMATCDPQKLNLSGQAIDDMIKRLGEVRDQLGLAATEEGDAGGDEA